MKKRSRSHIHYNTSHLKQKFTWLKHSQIVKSPALTKTNLMPYNDYFSFSCSESPVLLVTNTWCPAKAINIKYELVAFVSFSLFFCSSFPLFHCSSVPLFIVNFPTVTVFHCPLFHCSMLLLTNLWYTPHLFANAGLEVEKKETNAFRAQIIVPTENRIDTSSLQVQRNTTRPFLQRIRSKVIFEMSLLLLPAKLVQIKPFLFSKYLSFPNNLEQFWSFHFDFTTAKSVF